MSTLAILGASGHGKVIADTALSSGCWDKVSFFDDDFCRRKTVGPWSVLGDSSLLLDRGDDYDAVIIGIGNN